MGVTVGVNQLSVVHKGSGGVTIAFPDVCKTPAPPSPSPIPIPYPNIAKSSDSAKTAKKVYCDGNKVCNKASNFSRSNGDEPGTLNGIVSNKVMDKAEFVNFSFDVFFEGKNAVRALDLMLHNAKNTPPFPLIQPPIISLPGDEDAVCLVCEEKF